MIIDFYSILPLTCALFVLFFGFFIIWQDISSRMNQLLFGFCLSMLFWMFGTFMMFAMRGDLAMAIFWDRFVYFGVVFMPPFMHHFSLLFTKRAGQQKILLYINYTLAFFFLLAASTPYFVDDLYYYSWGVHSQARILHTIFLGYFFIGTGLFFVNLWRAYKKNKDRLFRLQTVYSFIAFAIVIFIGGSAYLFAYGIDTKFPFSYVTGLIFPIMLFYAVSRHHLLGAKVVTTEVLVGLTEFLVVMQIFFSNTPTDVVLRVLFAIAVAVIGILLINSVRKEVKRREEITNLARSLERANIRLQELDKQKTEFLSIAAHQLRTPLSILKGYIELICDGAYGKVCAKTVRALTDMDTSNEHLIKLVDDFLDISRIEQGRTKFVFKQGDLNKVVKDVVNDLTEKAANKHLQIAWSPNRELTHVYMDEEKIHHVVYNYVDNAIKYTEQGRIGVMLEKEEEGVVVRVKDKGVGFDKIDEANFFQKFYRGNNVKKTNVDGTGLGLFVCRKFIEAHGGRVWAHSRGLGQGSEFGFWIPLGKK